MMYFHQTVYVLIKKRDHTSMDFSFSSVFMNQ